MNTLSRIEHLIIVFALVSLSSIDKKEKENKLDERLKRSQQKPKTFEK